MSEYLQPLKVGFIKATEHSFLAKDGKEKPYYKIQFDYNGDVVDEKCTKDVYEKLLEVPKFTEMILTTSLRRVYGKLDFRIVGFHIH